MCGTLWVGVFALMMVVRHVKVGAAPSGVASLPLLGLLAVSYLYNSTM